MRALGFALLFVASGCAGGTLPRPAVVQNAAGARLLAKGRLDDAEARFRLALEYHPRFADAHANLGVVALHRGDPVAAEAHFRRAIRLNEDFAIAQGDLGVALERQGRVADAERAYEEALAIDPGLVTPRMGLAALLVRASRFAEARAHLMRLVQLEPGSAPAQGLLAYVELRLGRPGAAEARVSLLLVHEPDARVGRLVRGILRGLRGDLEAAAEDIGAALDDPLLGDAARVRLAAVRVEQGLFEEAERTLAPLLARSADDPAVELVARRLSRPGRPVPARTGAGPRSTSGIPVAASRPGGPFERDEGPREGTD